MEGVSWGVYPVSRHDHHGFECVSAARRRNRRRFVSSRSFVPQFEAMALAILHDFIAFRAAARERTVAAKSAIVSSRFYVTTP